MGFDVEARASDSPLVDAVMYGCTVGSGSTIRPAETHWHLVLARYEGSVRLLVVGPWTQSGRLAYAEGAELLWIRFQLGAFFSHLPTRDFVNSETPLPAASGGSFWLKGAAWQFPTYENADTFVARLVREEILVTDPIVNAALQDQVPEVSPRTVRHRFLRATGQTQSHIRQFERAQQAAALLRQGTSILDTVYEAGYYDQPHMTRALKRFIGYTPLQIIAMRAAE